jgi:glucose/arabinose dehydrogenase
MLRITSTGGIPTNNPFFNVATGDNRAIWALGVRNPFTFTFQSGSGRMFINDVGQNTWEERILQSTECKFPRSDLCLHE